MALRKEAVPPAELRHPGPQRQLRTNYFGSTLMWMLIAAMVLVSIYAFLQENFVAPSWWPDGLRGVKILDTNNALTILVALLSLVALRQQFIHSLKPFLTYSTVQSTTSTHLGSGERMFWGVNVNNAGTGMAIISKVLYRVALPGEQLGHYDASFSDVVTKLRTVDLNVGSDFVLAEFSEGAIIPAAGTPRVFEIGFEAAKRVQALDMKITFESRTGDLYEREIFALKRGGLPDVPAMAVGSPPQPGAPGVPGSAPGPPPSAPRDHPEAAPAYQSRSAEPPAAQAAEPVDSPPSTAQVEATPPSPPTDPDNG